MKTIFLLSHVYEKEHVEHIKFIGVFDSQQKAQDVIEELRVQPGFADHGIECFVISEPGLNKYEWKEGFISWDEAGEEDVN